MKNTLLTLLMASSILACKQQDDTYIVVEKRINEAVYASGELYPEHYENLSPGTPERVLKILVSEEDSVMPGDLLVVLGTASEDTQLEILSDQVAIARHNAQENEAVLTNLREEIDLARSRYLQDSIDAERYADLARDKAVSDQEAEQARMKAESSLKEYRRLQNHYSVSKNDLRNELLTAEKNLVATQKDKESRVLKSTVQGKVYSINLQEGELSRPDEPVLMIGSIGKFKLELLVDERDISKIRLGQKVLFETDAFNDQQFEATITKIVPVLQQSTRSFKVEAKVKESHDFFPQSSVEANIVIRENAKALLIPAEFLLEGDSVLVTGADQDKKVKLVTGVRQSGWIEVKEGLKSGDELIKND